MIPKLGHGHGPPWNKPDSYAFADSIIKDDKPWCRQKRLIKFDKTKVMVIFESSEALSDPVLVYSMDKGVSGERKWLELAAKGNQAEYYEVEVALPEAVTGWFVNVRSGELTVSSDYQE